MSGNGDRLLYLGLGPIAAILLGAALMPLRELTVASNFTFAFLALTIVVGELGGRGPAVATALTAALSLDFFLTRPYLKLAIHGKDDVIAFLGLSACGLLAAWLGSPRRARIETRRQMDALVAALRQVEQGGPTGSRLQSALDAVRLAFPVAAVAVSDERDQLLAGSGDRTKTVRVPGLLASWPDARDVGGPSWNWWQQGVPLPEEGLRVPLVVRARPVGSLALWGDGRPVDRQTRRALGAVAHVVAALVAEEGRSPEVERPPASWVAPARRSGD